MAGGTKSFQTLAKAGRIIMRSSYACAKQGEKGLNGLQYFALPAEDRKTASKVHAQCPISC